MTTQDYTLLRKIGVGSSAKVWKAKNNYSGNLVAIKIFDMEKINPEYIHREIVTFSMQNHPNIVKYYSSRLTSKLGSTTPSEKIEETEGTETEEVEELESATETEPELWLVMEYMDLGTCDDLLQKTFPDGMPECLVATILKEALTGLQYIHESNVVHRDIKGSNILLTKAGEVKIADFGVSGILDRNGRKQTMVGTPAWMAPEVMELGKEGYGISADIWSFGMTALELAYGRAPYAKYQPLKIMMMTIQCPPLSLEGRYSKSFKEMVKLCLQKEPDQRITASQLLKHRFFKQAKDQQYIISQLQMEETKLKE